MLWVALGWLALSAIELGLVVSSTRGMSSYDVPPLGKLVTFYASLATLWTLLTPAIAWWTRAASRLRGGAWSGVAASIVGVALAGVIDAFTRRTVIAAEGAPSWLPFWGTWLYFIDVVAAQYCAVVLATRVLEAHDALVARTRGELALRARLARSRLTHLEAQLQPHFLFNALGAVSELAYEAPAMAARMLRQLAALLRGATERRGEEVTLAEELATLEPYVEIQRLRFADWLRFEQRVSPDARDVLVPRLLLQPIVENAVKHGLLGRSSAGRIEILARVEDGRLRLAVRDNGVGLGAPGHCPGHGIGLRNVRERLVALYGDDASLALHAAPHGGTEATLDLPARRGVPNVTGEFEAAGVPNASSGRVLDLVGRHPAVATAMGWFLWGSAWVGQSRAYLVLRNRMAEAAMPRVLVTHFVGAALWALATPFVAALARAIPLQRRGAAWRVAVHLALATSIALGQALAWRALLERLLTGEVPPWPAAYVTSIFVSVLAYFILLGVTHYARAMAWLREREVTTAALRAELAEAQLHAAETRAQPEALVATLEALADQVPDDVVGTERAIADLAESLRETLDARRALAETAA